MKGLKKKISFDEIYEKWGVYIALLILVIGLTCMTNNFLTGSNIINIFRQCAVYMILSFGVTFVFIGGFIDLSIGYNICMSSCVFAICVAQKGINIWVALIITLAFGAVVGAANAFLVSVLKINPFLATLGTQYLLKGGSLLITNETAVTGIPEEAAIFGGYTDFVIPYQVTIAAIVFAILFVVLNHTKTGRYTFAIGSNESAARLSGVNVRKITFIDFMICGVCAALCGVVLVARMKMGSATICSGYEMDAIAAVCIGGTSSGGGRGSLVKTIAGALTLTVIRNGLNILSISTSMQSVIIGAVIIVVVALDMRQQRKLLA